MQGGLSEGTGPGEVAVTATATSSTENNSDQCPESPTKRLVYGTSWTQDDVIVALLTIQVVLLIVINARQ